MEHDKELKSFFTEDKEKYPFYFDLSQEEPPLRIDAQMQARTSLQQGLLIAIQSANQKLASKGLSLVKDIRLYKTRLPGKNFKPKTDLPALSLYQKICDLKVQDIAVQIINKEKAILKVEIVAQEIPQKTILEKGNAKTEKSETKEISSKLNEVTVTKKMEGQEERKA